MHMGGSVTWPPSPPPAASASAWPRCWRASSPRSSPPTSCWSASGGRACTSSSRSPRGAGWPPPGSPCACTTRARRATCTRGCACWLSAPASPPRWVRFVKIPVQRAYNRVGGQERPLARRRSCSQSSRLKPRSASRSLLVAYREIRANFPIGSAAASICAWSCISSSCAAWTRSGASRLHGTVGVHRSGPTSVGEWISRSLPWSALRRRPSASRTSALEARRTSGVARISTSTSTIWAHRRVRAAIALPSALGEEFFLGRLAEPPKEGDVDRRARRLFDALVGPNPARADAGGRGTRACLPTARGRYRVSDRAERGPHALEQSHDRPSSPAYRSTTVDRSAAAARSSCSAAAGPGQTWSFQCARSRRPSTR